jgi:Uma2 family endonuclease
MASAIDISKSYNYADYLTWSDEERWEIIGGVPYNMSPAPSTRHQRTLGELHIAFRSVVRKPCEVFLSPFDVRLSESYDEEVTIENVVQPDLLVYCDKAKVDEKGGKGAPDLVVEILSPSTASKDIKTKLLLYQKFGVREYWIVDPDKDTVEVLSLDEKGRYVIRQSEEKEGTVESIHFKGLEVDLTALFSE